MKRRPSLFLQIIYLFDNEVYTDTLSLKEICPKSIKRTCILNVKLQIGTIDNKKKTNGKKALNLILSLLGKI